MASTDNNMDVDIDNKDDMFDENAKTKKMDLISRTGAALGMGVMKQLSQLKVLIIGLKGTGVETAKNIILTGVKSVELYDNDIVEIADLGTNFYLKKSDVGQKSRSDACTKLLDELNRYCPVTNYKGVLNQTYIQSFGAVIITKTLPQKELIRINNLCRTNKILDSDGKYSSSLFILAVTHGISAHIFSDFGDNHLIHDADGDPPKTFVIDNFEQNGLITIDKDPSKRHGLYDGDMISIQGIKSEDYDNKNNDIVSIEKLNELKSIKIKRKYIKIQITKADGKIETRTKQIFNQFYLDFVGTDLENKILSKWKTGGLINEIKPIKTLNFRSLSDCLNVPVNSDNIQQVMYGPQHPNQNDWIAGKGKIIHLSYCSALQFNEEKGYFPRLHNKDDSKEFTEIFRKINLKNKDCGIDNACYIDGAIDTKRINGYSWYFNTELTGYCSFLGGIASQEIVKKFGKYTPIQQWLHCDHINLIGTEIPSDAIPQSSRYDNQISIFGKSFQHALSNQNIFLVGTGALGCEYLKGLSLMGVATGNKGKVICTDMDHIEISNLSRQFLFREKHVGCSKSVIAAQAARDINPSFNVEELEMKVWPGTENYFNDQFWDNLDVCWNALDNVTARKYTDNKCLLHSLPLLESGTQGTKCNSEVIIPFKTKSYNDGAEQETDGIPMCTLANFPYLPVHCIEWARSKFVGLFENQPKIYNTFIKNENNKFYRELNELSDAEKYETCKIIEKFINIDLKNKYSECIKFAFNEFVGDHIFKIKDLMFTFPENEVIKNKTTGQIIGKFWSGHKKYPNVPIFDLNNKNILNYLYSTTNIWAHAFGFKLKSIPTLDKFKEIAQKCNLTVPQWKEPVGLKIKVDDNADDDDDDNDNDQKQNELKDKEMKELIEKFKKIDKTHLLQKMEEIAFEKDDDTNFHIDFITSAANARANNYLIDSITRYQCKIIAGKIIAALASTTSMICGVVQLEFYKLLLGLKYVHQNTFYNWNINLGVSKFDIFSPENAITHDNCERQDDMDLSVINKYIAYPPKWTSWDSLIIDEGNLSINEFVNKFPQIFNGIIVKQLHKPIKKKEKGVLLYNLEDERKTTQADRQLANKKLPQKARDFFLKQKQKILEYNSKIEITRKQKLIDRYIELYGKLIDNKKNYVILTGEFLIKNNNNNINETVFADLPRIKYFFQ